MKRFLQNLEKLLENIDSYRDKFLFIFIKRFWPNNISPNYVTYPRLAIGIALFILLFILGIENKTLILWLFFIGVFTDFVDGPIARGTGQVTEFGAMLDSLSDRIIIIPIAVYSLFSTQKWLLIILILMEVLNTAASLYYKSKAIYLESNIFGKIKMVLMSVVLIAILIIWPNPPSRFFAALLWLTVPVSFLSILTRIRELKNRPMIIAK